MSCPQWLKVLCIVFFILLLIIVVGVLAWVFAFRDKKDDPVSMKVAGNWQSWRPWTTCSATCGSGTQSRVRPCSDPAPEFGGAPCTGASRETRACADWLCDDCERSCPPDGVLRNCAVCECQGESLEGQVLDKYTRLPVYGANIFDAHQRWSALAVTDTGGKFALQNVCSSSSLTLVAEKKNYLLASVQTDAGISTVQIELQEKRKPQFITHPVDTAVFESDAVSLSCEVTGEPSPLVQWYKDGVVLDGFSDSPLRIQQSTRGDSGMYQCRAVSETGKVFSHPGRLTVARGTDTCEEEPLKKTMKLPKDCYTMHSGQHNTFIDVKKCSCSSCKSSSVTSGSCRPIRTESAEITCKGFSYQISCIAACGCTNSPPGGDLTLLLRAVSAGDEVRETFFDDVQINYILDGVEILHYFQNGEVMAEVPADRTRAVFVVNPSGYSYAPVMTQTRVVTYSGNPGETVVIKLSLLLRPDAINVDAANSATFVPKGFDGVDSDIEVDIPEDFFYNSDGTPYTDQARVFVAYSDPRQVSSLSTAAGQFVYDDEEGYTQLLETYGVFTIQAEDTTSQQLMLNGPMRVGVSGPRGAELDDGETSLWTLDSSSGKWEEVNKFSTSNMTFRQKRQAAGSEAWVDVRGTANTFNIDKPFFRGRQCQVQIRVYTDETLKVGVTGMRITVYTLSENGFGYIVQAETYTDSEGWACVVIRCGLTHEIVAHTILSSVKWADKHHLPDGFEYSNNRQRTQEIRFTSPPIETITDGDGPVHRYQASTCALHADAGSDKDYHFRFIVGEVISLGVLYPDTWEPGLRNSFYQHPEQSRDHEVCMIRIDITSPEQLDVIAYSSEEVSDGVPYGVYVTSLWQRYDPEFQRDQHIACIQVKCPGYNVTSANLTNVNTHVDIHLVMPDEAGPCKFYGDIVPEEEQMDFSGDYFGHSESPIVYIDETESSLVLQLRNITGRSSYARGFFRRYGPHSASYRNVLSECLNTWHTHAVAKYHCGENVPDFYDNEY